MAADDYWELVLPLDLWGGQVDVRTRTNEVLVRYGSSHGASVKALARLEAAV